MKENFKNFIKRARAKKLSENEKDILRSKILEFISFNPIRGKAPILRDRNYISIFEVKYFMRAASIALVCVLVVGGSGVSYAAAKALPGETLYSVKININENIEETFATTPKAKLAVQSEHIQRRLDEAQELRKEQKLSPANQKIVVAKIGEHTALAVESMDALKEQGDVATVLETTAKLTPVLEANRDILSDPEKNETAEGLPEDRTSIVAIVDDSIKVVQEQENSIIASVEADNSDASIAMMSVGDEPTAKMGPSEEEIAAKKVSNEVKAISRQISEIVQDRIDSAKDKLVDIKTEVRSEEAAKISSETKAQQEAVEKLETSLNNVLPVTSPAPTTTPINISIKTELTDKKSPVTTIEKAATTTPIVIEKPFVEVIETKIDTSEFDAIYTQIKLAEEILDQAENLLGEKNFRAALTLAQQANKIAEEIETHRRLKTLELSKKTEDTTSLKASVGSTVKAE